MRIGTKIQGGFLVVLAILCLVSATGYLSMRHMVGMAEAMYHDRLVPITQLAEVRTDALKVREQVLLHLQTNDPARQRTYEETIRDTEQKMQANLESFAKKALAPAEKAGLTGFRTAWGDYQKARGQVLALSRSGRAQEASTAAATGSGGARFRAALQAMNALVAANQQVAAQLERDVRSSAARANTIFLVMILVGIAAAVLVSRYLARSIAGPIRTVAGAARRLADGDLTVDDLYINSHDETGQMSAAFHDMLEQLRMIITQIRYASGQLHDRSQEIRLNAEHAAGATGQIATAIQQVAAGATQQSTSAAHTVEVMIQLRQAIEQIAVGAQRQAEAVQNSSRTMDQMAQAIEDVARSSQEVAHVAAEALHSARSGGHAVQQTLESMTRIGVTSEEAAGRVRELGQHSQEIGNIIQIIRDIADQTNLLALNAAIEAARAGEHGKGFAVVAEEVRRLAERSGHATQEIGNLVTSIQTGVQAAVEAMVAGTREVEAGSALAGSTGQALGEILAAMERTNMKTQSISAAIEEIAAATSEVVRAVDEVAQISTQNAAATEEMSAGAEEVSLSIQQVASVSQETAAAAEEVGSAGEEVKASSEGLSGLARSQNELVESLEKIVSQFRLGAELVSWNEGYRLRVDDMDQQHMRLFTLINGLYSDIMEDRGYDAIGERMAELVQYTRTHLSDEEKLMKRYNYPDFTQHKAIHDRITKRVLDLDAQFRAGNAAVAMELLMFVKDWLTGHIMGVDKKYGAYINKKGSGKIDEQHLHHDEMAPGGTRAPGRGAAPAGPGGGLPAGSGGPERQKDGRELVLR